MFVKRALSRRWFGIMKRFPDFVRNLFVFYLFDAIGKLSVFGKLIHLKKTTLVDSSGARNAADNDRDPENTIACRGARSGKSQKPKRKRFGPCVGPTGLTQTTTVVPKREGHFSLWESRTTKE